GAGINHVGAGVGPEVDAGDDEVGRPRQDRLDGDLHAVGRHPIHGVAKADIAPHDLLGPQRKQQRDGVPDGAALGVRRYHLDVADLAQLLPGGEDSSRVNAVVVGEEDQRFRHDYAINDAPCPPVYWTRRRWKTPSWSSCGPRLGIIAAGCAAATIKVRSSARSATTTIS